MTVSRFALPALAALGLVAALGCRADTSGLATLSISDLAAILAAQDEVTICDANTADTRGDEGELFRRTLSGERLTRRQVAEIRAEDDHGIIEIDGREGAVEFWNPFKAIAKAAKGVVRGVKKAAKAVARGRIP